MTNRIRMTNDMGADGEPIPTRQLLLTLDNLDVKLSVSEGRLNVKAPSGVLTAALRDTLSAQKPALIQLLSARAAHEIKRQARDRPIALSVTQERFLFLAQLVPEAVMYNLPNLHRLTGPLDVRALQQAFEALAMRHEVLRTVFAATKSGPIQQLALQPNHGFRFVDVCGSDDPAAQALALAQADADEAFDLAAGPVLRVLVCKLAAAEHWLCWTIHHAASDGWSSMIVLRELKVLYEAAITGEAGADMVAGIDAPALQYADYGVWERSRLDCGGFDRDLQYWRRRFSTLPEPLNIPTDFTRPAVLDYRGDSLPLSLSEADMEGCRRLARSARVTPFTVLLTVFKIMLARHCGQTDICVGSPIARRNHPELENVVGCFSNALALRSDLSGNPTVTVLLERVRASCIDAFAHQDVPFESVVEAVDPVRDTSITPLFQVMFIHHVQDARKVDCLGPVSMSALSLNARASKFDLTLELFDTGHGARGYIEYSTALFARDTVAAFADRFKILLAAAIAEPHVAIGALKMLTDAEHHRLIVTRNASEQDWGGDARPVHELVSRQARRTPAAIAVQGPHDQMLTYAQLEDLSGCVARGLQRAGVGRGDRVGVYLERDVSLVCALLGILKAGAAYVPLDPGFPAERIGFMIDDARLSLVVTSDRLAGVVPGRVVLSSIDALLESGPQVDTTISGDQDLQVVDSEVVDSQVADSLAYVIYTSGSTGKPKGVKIGHTALTNFLLAMRQAPGLMASDRVLAVTTLSFDIAALELFLPLIVGARTVLASREEAVDPQRLAQRLVTCSATVMQATPSTWRMLIEHGWEPTSTLRIFCGGEVLPRELANRLLGSQTAVWNLYGPTETTIWSTIERVTRDDAAGVVTPVGRPIANTQVYVLDSFGSPVPDGVAGELFIGGLGLAQGYHDRDSLTAERFAADPFTNRSGARLYRTGDRARWLPDGRLQVSGRADDQVKVRGHRIEPGEIAAAVLTHTSVRECVVTVREDVPGDVRLVAYFVRSGAEANQATVPDSRVLHAHLQKSLPEYMIPGDWVEVKAMPLTPNGKIDRLTLPAPERPQPVDARARRASTAIDPAYSHSQKTGLATADAADLVDAADAVAGIWARLLGIREADRQRGFFDQGGHSLLAVRLVAALKSELSLCVSLLELFQGASIDDLAMRLRRPAGQVHDCCIALHKHGDRTPFFMVGSNPYYRRAAARLDARQPVWQLDAYALQSRLGCKDGSGGADGFGTFSRFRGADIEDLARRFIVEMRRVQPRGPWRIGGGCEGALVAYEIALQLQQTGERVDDLILWVTPGPGATLDRVFGGATWRRLWHQIQSLRVRGSLRALGLAAWMNLLRHEWVEYQLFDAMLRYRPGHRFAGRLTLARVQGPHDPLYEDNDLGWRVHATRGVDIWTMPGDHDTWLREHADVFGDFLAARLFSPRSVSIEPTPGAHSPTVVWPEANSNC